MDDRDRLEQLKERHDFDRGAIGAAEDLGWIIACLCGVLAYDFWHSWLLSAVILGASYFVATFRYRKSEGTAEDAYYRAAGLGKYYTPTGTPEGAPPPAR